MCIWVPTKELPTIFFYVLLNVCVCVYLKWQLEDWQFLYVFKRNWHLFSCSLCLETVQYSSLAPLPWWDTFHPGCGFKTLRSTEKHVSRTSEGDETWINSPFCFNPWLRRKKSLCVNVCVCVCVLRRRLVGFTYKIAETQCWSSSFGGMFVDNRSCASFFVHPLFSAGAVQMTAISAGSGLSPSSGRCLHEGGRIWLI